MTKLIILNLDGDLFQGVRVTLTIVSSKNTLIREITGSLPPNPNLKTALDQWHTNYGRN
ncbi:MAG: hypothetical protein KME64_16205 [Scytonematopsis contorta HA4267-MV1]|jgi:hypothetical protein|nr:hypothetical protein [Scytonematopsis contorta HA4267-MV1]